jgi:hypothetical protein
MNHTRFSPPGSTQLAHPSLLIPVFSTHLEWPPSAWPTWLNPSGSATWLVPACTFVLGSFKFARPPRFIPLGVPTYLPCCSNIFWTWTGPFDSVYFTRLIFPSIKTDRDPTQSPTQASNITRYPFNSLADHFSLQQPQPQRAYLSRFWYQNHGPSVYSHSQP